MADKRELTLDLLARDKTEAATRSAAKNIDNVADAADDASKSTEEFGKSSVIAGDETDKFGKKANDNAGRVSKLKAEISLAERELHSLAKSFADTDDAAERIDLSRAIRKAEGDIRRLNKNKGIIEAILPDDPGPAAKSFMTKLGAGLVAQSGELSAVMGGSVGPTIGAAAGVAAAPVLVGTLASALSAGAGGIGIGAGIALAVSRDPEIQQAGKDAAQRFTDAIGKGAQAAFSGPVKHSIDILADAGDEVAERWTKAFAALGPSVVPLTRDIAAAVVDVSDALAGVAETSGPALQGLGDSIRLVAGGVSDFIEIVADGGPEAAANLTLIAGATADMVRHTGFLLNLANELGNNPFLSGAVLPQLRKHYTEAAEATGTFVRHTNDASGAMTDAAEAAYVEGNALTNLAKDMRAQTDPVFGLLAAEDKLTEAQKNAAEATKEHGATSKEAKQALRDLAEAAIEVEGRAGDLAATSNGQLSPALRATLSAAGLTAAQINQLAGQFRGAKRDGDNFAKTYKAKLEADTATAAARVQHVRDLLAQVNSKRISLSVVVNESRLNKVNNTLDRFGGARAYGGPVEKNKAYVVGEHRPEVFVPNQDGTIVPSIDQFTGGGSRGGGQASAPREIRVKVDVTGAESRFKAMIREMFATGGLEVT